MPLLKRWDNHIILVDTGNGTKMNDKLRSIYSIDIEKSAMDLALKPFGIKEEDITDVIFTHLHFDHAGGGTIIKDGKVIPTFQNAKYFVQKDQLLWAESPTDKDRASFIKDNYLPLLSDGLLETIDGKGEIFQGISVIPLFGHTQSMQAVKISDGGQTLLFCADLCPTSAHIHIPFVMGYYNNPLKTIEEKKNLLPQAYEEGWILVFEHDAFMQAAKIINTERGFSAGEKIIITEKEIVID
jgi:glyoxylase-like metal-dependent hydrolase (beta-lactamase superfamily II)